MNRAFVLPSPNFEKPCPKLKPHNFLTPSGMSIMARERRPPPMYGPRGATIPGKFLKRMEPAQHETKIEPQFCEPCELELQSLGDLRRHKAQHQRCQVDNCTYLGHPDVMDKHVALVHSSGLFDKCKKLSTPEELAAWRDERRKRFPTLANVEIRKRAHEQRLRRGERLEVNKSRFGMHEDRLKMRKGEREQNKLLSCAELSEQVKRNRKNNRNQKKKKLLPNDEDKAILEKISKVAQKPKMEEMSSCAVEMFRGTKQLDNYKHLKATTVAAEQNVLTTLLGMYGSDEEGTDDDDCEQTTFQIEHSKSTKKHETVFNTFIQTSVANRVNNVEVAHNHVILTETPTSNISTQHNTNVYDAINEDLLSDEPPEESPIAKSSSIPEMMARTKPSRQQPKTNTLKQKSRMQIRGLDYRKARLRKQNTMLEKLLEPDIRHERNLLLQCVRFVCENNYLE